MNTAKNILQKSPTKESVSTQKLRKKTGAKTPVKEAASTECPVIERVGENDVRGVTVGIDHMSGENRFFIVSFYLLHLNAKFLPLKCHHPNNQLFLRRVINHHSSI